MGRAFEEALPILLAYLKSSRPSLPLRKAPPLISVFFNGLYTPFGSPVCGGQKPQGRRGKPPSGADFSTSPSLLQGELHILTKPQ